MKFKITKEELEKVFESWQHMISREELPKEIVLEGEPVKEFWPACTLGCCKEIEKPKKIEEIEFKQSSTEGLINKINEIIKHINKEKME